MRGATTRRQGAARLVETDAELWGRGDRAAFAELFDRHAEAVWNHAYRLTASWSLAEDLTSATFLAAWRRRSEVALVRDSALPWLYTVAGNLARTEFRRLGRLRRALARVPEPDVVPDHADRVASSVDDSDELRRVLAVVRTMPPAEREAVELCLLGELSAAEAAQVLGVAEVTVRSRISRARARLRATLDEEVS
ncbi:MULTISPECIES: RNA polymerase sigma factor [unclassified Saccharothrix]|uniref:RNA polymerase sigma factor n=1 Tax=unclassified Saccharothrix TaxID=2593673 RepID=UPI00307DAC46